MKILVTGAKGFIGKNLVAELKNQKYADIFEYDIDTDACLLDDYCKEAEFVFHLSGVKERLLAVDYVRDELKNWGK